MANLVLARSWRYDIDLTNPAKSRRVVVTCFDDMALLDVTGPLGVFAAATLSNPSARYDIRLAAEVAGPIVTKDGVALIAPHRLASSRGAIDTLLVPGWLGTRQPSGLVRHIRRLAARATRVVSVCSGAFLLAAAGLLDGRRATTHWMGCAALQAAYPRCRVDHNAIFVQDEHIWTSAGVTAGMDLTLALVEADHGAALALEVARMLVMYVRRPGGQGQFSAPLVAQAASQPGIRELAAWVRDHLTADLSVAALAGRAGMSERNFARVFRRETGATPARWVEQVRIEAARAALENGDTSMQEVAHAVGFHNLETLDRAFRRNLDLSPRAYRARFSRTR